MPPNLGGFFMVRSYYPSECHADYFDFERIEALKPAIEACGISTLSQSPMLGFHKQMDNRIKLLEEILFFFQAEDGIRDVAVTGVQTCALPISSPAPRSTTAVVDLGAGEVLHAHRIHQQLHAQVLDEIGRASCRERV